MISCLVSGGMGELGAHGSYGSYESYGSSWEFCVARRNWEFRKVLAVRKFRKLLMC